MGALMIRSLAQAVEVSLKARDSVELGAKFDIQVEGAKWSVYTVAIAERDILCYCDKGTATFVVDTYGVGTINARHTVELYDWEKDS